MNLKGYRVAMAVIAAAFLAMMLAGCNGDDNGGMDDTMMPPTTMEPMDPEEPMESEPPDTMPDPDDMDGKSDGAAGR